MNWPAVGAIGEIIGAFAVVATLLYLSKQIRQNTRAMHSSSFQATTDSLNQINMQVATDPALVRLYSSFTRASLDELSPEDRTRYSFVMLSLFRIRETAYFQKNEGTTAFQSWSREDVSLRANLASVAAREWWRETMFGFTPEFAAYVDQIIDEIERKDEKK